LIDDLISIVNITIILNVRKVL